MAELINLKPMGCVQLNDVSQGLYETAANICGGWRKSWVMQQMRVPAKCRMPRGFKATSSEMKIQYV